MQSGCSEKLPQHILLLISTLLKFITGPNDYGKLQSVMFEEEFTVGLSNSTVEICDRFLSPPFVPSESQFSNLRQRTVAKKKKNVQTFITESPCNTNKSEISVSTNLYEPQERYVQGITSKLSQMVIPVPQSCILKSGWVLSRPQRVASYKLPHKYIYFQIIIGINTFISKIHKHICNIVHQRINKVLQI